MHSRQTQMTFIEFDILKMSYAMYECLYTHRFLHRSVLYTDFFLCMGGGELDVKIF